MPLPPRLIDKLRLKAHETTFMGQPIKSLTVEELQAAVVFLITESRKQAQQRAARSTTQRLWHP